MLVQLAGRASAKAAGVVVVDDIVTPNYVSGLAPTVVEILLMAGAVYLCFEGAPSAPASSCGRRSWWR